MKPAAAGRLAFAIVAVASAVRFWKLGNFALGFDEAISVKCASAPTLPGVWGIPPAHARLFTDAWNSLLHFWMVLGRDPATIRALSACLGVAVLVLAWRVLSRILPSAPALAALALFAFSPFQVQYAQEARPYMAVLACEFGAFLALARAAGERGGARWWAAWALLCAGASAFHLVALAWVPASAAWVLARPGWRRHAPGLAGWGLLACAPAAVLAAADARGLSWMNAVEPAAVSLPDFLLGVVNQFGPGAWIPAPFVIPALAAFGVLLAAGLLVAVAPGRRGAESARMRAAVVAFGIVPPALVILGHWAGVVYLPKPRYAMAAQLFLLAAGARAVWAFRPPVTRAALLAVLLAADAASLARYFGGGVPTLDLAPVKKPFHEAAARIASRARPGDGVLSYGLATYLPLDFHLAGRLPHGYVLRDPMFDDGELGILGFPVPARDFLRRHRTAWVVVAPVTWSAPAVPPPDLLAALRRAGVLRGEETLPGIRIQRWERRP